MKARKFTAAFCALVLAAGVLTGCGSTDEDVKIITKENETAVTAGGTETAGDTAGSEDATQYATGAILVPAGYIFTADGYSFAPNMDMTEVLEGLKNLSYTEYKSPSCAFEGLEDKVYTFEHFEVDTYPSADGSHDYVSYIVLRDDLISTPENVCIGDDKAAMEAAYGTDYSEEGSGCIYTKDDMELQFIFTDGKISAIMYVSKNVL